MSDDLTKAKADLSTPAVPAVGSWRNNAELLVDVARLGYIGDTVLDLSHNAGRFWTAHRPKVLRSNDLDWQWPTDFHHDVTLGPLPSWRDVYDTVVWDGPYRFNGTPDLGDFDRRYGTGMPARWRDRMLDLKLGTVTAIQSTRPGGTVLVKCQDQVVSGAVRFQTTELAAVGELFDAPLIDRFHLVRPLRKQPAGRAQLHARNNVSTLLVFRRAG